MATGLQNTTRSPVAILPAPAATSADRPSSPSPRPAGEARSATRTATIPACPGNSRPAFPQGPGLTTGGAAARRGAATLAGGAEGMSEWPGNEAPWLVRIIDNPHC